MTATVLREAFGGFAESIVATIREPLVVLHADLRVKEASASFYRSFQATPEETEGRCIFDLGNGQWDIPKLRELLEEISRRDISFEDFEVEHEFPVIGRRTMVLNARRVRAGVVPSPLILLAIEDITARKEAEQKLHRLNADLERRVEERTAELAATNKELVAFSYSVSHDLRAPLRGIDGFSRILLEEYAPQLPAEAQRYLRLVREHTQQMGRLVDDLLSFCRLGRQALQKQRLSPADVARGALEDLHAEAEGRQVEMKIGNLPACDGDPALLRQVFVNLLSNALKFTRTRAVARVEVGWEYTAGVGGAYFVRDNGVGFDMRYAGKLFGVFQRLHRAEDYEGTGVGLAIVQRVVHRHGGRVWAEAGLDRGATFYFTLEGCDE